MEDCFLMALELHESTRSLSFPPSGFSPGWVSVTLFKGHRVKGNFECLLDRPDKVNYSPQSFALYQSLESEGTFPTQEEATKCHKVIEALLPWLIAHKTMFDYQDLVEKQAEVMKLGRSQHVFELLQTKNKERIEIENGKAQ